MHIATSLKKQKQNRHLCPSTALRKVARTFSMMNPRWLGASKNTASDVERVKVNGLLEMPLMDAPTPPSISARAFYFFADMCSNMLT